MEMQPRSFYSKRQLSTVNFKISRGIHVSPFNANVKCRNCTGEQLAELTCTVCGELKDMTQYSRAQRKKPDDAVSFVLLPLALAGGPSSLTGRLALHPLRAHASGHRAGR